MFGTEQNLGNFLFIYIRILKQAQFEFGSQYLADGIIYAAHGEFLFINQFYNGIRKLRTMHVHIHSILYALQIRVFQCSGGAMLFVHLLNIHPVAHYKPVEFPGISQDILHQVFTGMAGHSVKFIMCHHESICACIQAIFKRRHENLVQCTVGDIARSTIDAIDRLASTDKVFGTGQYFILSRKVTCLKSSDGSCSHLSYKKRVFTKGLSHPSPTGITSHFYIGSKCPMGTGGTHFKSSLARSFFSQFRFEGCSLSDGSRINGSSSVESGTMNGINADK